MKFFVGFCCFLYVFFLACGSLNCFVFSLLWIFSEDSDLQPVFRRYYWCFSSLIILSWSLMFMFEISVSTVFTFLDSTIESSELLVLHVDSSSRKQPWSLLVPDIPLQQFEAIKNLSLPAYFSEIYCSQLYPEDMSEERLHTSDLNGI